VATLPANEKPGVKKVPLAVSGHEGEVYLDELGDVGIPDNAGWRLANERGQILSLHSPVGRLRCKIIGLKETHWTKGDPRGGKYSRTMTGGIRDAAVKVAQNLNAA
jgi:hypothetical protein